MEGKRSKKRKRAKRLKFQNEKDDSAAVEEIDERKEEEESAACAFAKRPKSQGLSKSSTFLEKMRARLSGGHFRMINEKLYTCTGKEALEYFKEDPELFNVYHAGYQEQMSHWPEKPVNIIIKWLKDHSPSLVVADFGCGDAQLAKNVKNKVFSFDLVANDPSVIACDMSKTPLDSSVVDVAVFCLSLMGTNLASYLKEAHRVLKSRGWLLIAEVRSRFDPNTGGADPKTFSKAVCELGFTSIFKDFSNKMFILLYFKKKDKQTSKKTKEIEWPELKPCLYKRR
ncbi:ribosomal RNA-processing protein 8 [Alnus glutinosa]|uniref:ribosomal RNA-processing protein 8 n=1 Tax=Alnus glutinosa TaxID=3517 RepID=UPI002D799FAE|nr:ribosomal RNA-processing protein 8 [Alnus glutinosa]